MGFIIGTCFLCNKNKQVRLRKSNNEYVCQKCYLEKLVPKEECFVCKEFKNVQMRDGYSNPICRKCYNQPKETCSICSELDIVQARDEEGKPVCPSCHKRPVEICNICKKLKEVSTRNENREPICKTCNLSKGICSKCGRSKVIVYKNNNENFCQTCRTIQRLKTDEVFHTLTLLRRRVRKAINLYSITGKIKKSDEYGINFESIIKHLGPCPGNKEDYHIDHILPLSAFDFNNLEQIKLAFAPENHQWLKKEDNLRKNDKYNKQEFLEYLTKFGGK